MPFLGSKYAKIAFAAGVPPQTPLGELTVLPKPPSWIKGPTSKGRRGERAGNFAQCSGRLQIVTSSSAVAKRLRDASCLSVVSFNNKTSSRVFYCYSHMIQIYHCMQLHAAVLLLLA